MILFVCMVRLPKSWGNVIESQLKVVKMSLLRNLNTLLHASTPSLMRQLKLRLSKIHHCDTSCVLDTVYGTIKLFVLLHGRFIQT